jgi:thioredoxin 1
MTFEAHYTRNEPTRDELLTMDPAVLVEFGTPSCGWCRAAQPHIAAALADFPQVRHLKIEDGSGRPLGRSFAVTLWPTLVFLRDGHEVARLVRPQGEQAIRQELQTIAATVG